MVSFGELCSALSRVGYCNTQAAADADALVYVKVCTVRARCVCMGGGGAGRGGRVVSAATIGTLKE